ncbi:head maturation protease, ClpP-related [Roseomonas sp. BN140053]|uniref:head maturation protease, ClpP-related n=1 Tax=Roseomonas sp. BN140053 TaxID=3391898 RepID=UPI0039EB6BF6
MPDFPLRLHGDIGGEITVAGVAASLEKAGRSTLAISLNSYGGDALAGIAIHNLLARHPGQKTVTIEGVAASAASLVAMAGERIVMPSNAFLMIHNAWTLAMGDEREMDRTGELLRQVSGALRRTYAARTGKSEAEVAELMAAETWFDAPAALANGFATDIAEPVEIRASAAGLARFHHVPAALARTLSTTLPAQPAHLENTMNTAPTAAVPPGTAPAAPALPAASLPELRAIANATRGALPDSWVLAQLEAGATISAARDAAFDALALLTPPRSNTAFRVGIDHDAPHERREAMSEALTARILNRAPAGSGGRYAGYSMPEMAREVLEASGTATRGWAPARLIEGVLAATGTMTTSDFPALLGGAANRTLAELYPRAQSPLRLALCRVTSASDFRLRAGLRISNMPTLEKVPEAAAVRYGSLTETGESYALDTYAKNLSLTRQALINDDLDAFGQALRGAATAAAEAEARELVRLLTMNNGAGPTLSDGAALFTTDRGTLATAAGTFDDTGLGAGRKAIRGHKDVGDGGPLGIPPRYLLVSPDQETAAEKQLSQLSLIPFPSGGASVSPFAGRLELLVEPRLSGNAWWLFADPAQAPVFECAYLNGNQVPTVQSFEEAAHLGVTLRVVHDFGAGITGWRGAYRNAGAA